MDAAQYLRKSRGEEGMDTDEVLARHRQALAEYAAQHGIHIVETYREVVSGGSLYARPEMLRLLQDVEEGKYDAVLCMDLDRLSRGNMRDQGLILDTFKDTGTLIVTPEKTYDLSDEMDDELAEFKTFFSRREYKMIRKRLRRGLAQSIQAGCYVSNAPYGYKNIYVDKRPTLEIIPEEADFVRMMFRMYADGYGCTSIANHVNLLGAHPRRTPSFGRTTVAAILRNPVYIGKVSWNKRTRIKSKTAQHASRYNPRAEWKIADGLHPAIVDVDLYDKVQAVMAGRYRPSKQDGTIKTSLVGLVKCANCGANMQRRTLKGMDYLLCQRPGCCASAQYDMVEDAVLDHLRETLESLTAGRAPSMQQADPQDYRAMLAAVRKEQAAAERQKARLYDLLEMGEYDLETFRERMPVVKGKIAALANKAQEIQDAMDQAANVDQAAQARKIAAVLDAYADADPARRNALLHSIVDRIIYTKEKKTKPSDFHLQIKLKPY